MFKYTVPVITLISGLLLSSIAAFYSVYGMTKIFVGGGLSIILLFSFLEFAKIIATISLKKHWNDSVGVIKPILILFILFTMLITSLGTYGYLSKSSQQSSESVNINSAKVLFLEENIKREQSKLDNNATQINQYNELLSRLIVKDIRTASNERKRIQSQISALNKSSNLITNNIDTLNNQLLPYKTEVKKLEVEVGPLLFITKSIYGEDYKSHMDKVLAILIILVVFIFDPFAITLLIMSQKSFQLIGEQASYQEKDSSKSSPTIIENDNIIDNNQVDTNIKDSSIDTKNEVENLEKVYTISRNDDVENEIIIADAQPDNNYKLITSNNAPIMTINKPVATEKGEIYVSKYPTIFTDEIQNNITNHVEHFDINQKSEVELISDQDSIEEQILNNGHQSRSKLL